MQMNRNDVGPSLEHDEGQWEPNPAREGAVVLEACPNRHKEGTCEMSIIDLPLDRAPRRPDITRSVCRGAARHLRERGYATITEMTFANGRRGDIVALSPSGDLLVVEVKSGIEDYRIDGKWPDYREYCDAFCFAVAPEFPAEILPEDVGLIVADGYGGALIREAPRHPLAPARRKALTIAFGRLAAARLAGLEDPAAPR
jgi:hypothetical protein